MLLNSVETYAVVSSLWSSVWKRLQMMSQAEMVTFCAPMNPVNSPLSVLTLIPW